MQGRAVDEYRAPLFFAWQLTNRCTARCIACCEESGPDKAWRDELTRDEALRRRAAHRRFRHPVRRVRRRRAARRCALLGDLRRARRRRRRAQARDRRQPHRRCRRRSPRGARGPVRADLGGRRHGGDARTRAARARALRGAIGAIERLVARGLVAAVRVRAHPLQPARDRRRLRSRGLARLQRVRHRAADAHRPRRGSWDADRVQRRRVAARGRRAREHARMRATTASRCRSIRGTSSPRWRSASRVRRRCCWWCRTARSSS